MSLAWMPQITGQYVTGKQGSEIFKFIARPAKHSPVPDHQVHLVTPFILPGLPKSASYSMCTTGQKIPSPLPDTPCILVWSCHQEPHCRASPRIATVHCPFIYTVVAKVQCFQTLSNCTPPIATAHLLPL